MTDSNIPRKLDWQEVPIDDIQPYPRNPKAHGQEQIEFVAHLLQTYGWTQPICLDKNNEIIFGHCRLESAKLLGETTVPCVFREDLTEAQVKALRIADNKSNESPWINSKLDLELVELQALDVKLEDVGFKVEDTGKLQNPSEFWENMPGFEQEDAGAYKTIKVHFQTSDDIDKFANLIGQKITERTKYVWFPKLENKKFGYVDDES